MRHPLAVSRDDRSPVDPRAYTDLDRPGVSAERALTRLVRAGGVVRHPRPDDPDIRAWVDDRTGHLSLRRGDAIEPAGNVIGAFLQDGTWSGILPVDADARLTLTLHGTFDLTAAMALEQALGGLRCAAERTMTEGTPLSATIPEWIAFLLNLMDDTARFVRRATIPDGPKRRRLARPDDRLHHLAIVYDGEAVAEAAIPVYITDRETPGTWMRTIRL